ncbi:hypothetical protein B0H66DRAFT_6119 [Apodospora peruviana]|uniref:FAD-binding domain-containing protein n=1 Tax=Apodospora peruviana TaxID=516989 RepID=A0AAE0IQ64_9PEZI|nr:hypothetical protein B0H66DRAFT_6119 [Apodospora peruviana]
MENLRTDSPGGIMASVATNSDAHVDSSTPLIDDHPIPLKISIVGAGIGGLTAAIGLRRNGHEVHLFEQSRFANEIGAAVHLAPNSNGILRRWGIFAEHFGANPMEGMVECTQDGQVRRDIPFHMASKRWQHPWHLVHRVNLHDRLKKLATSQDEAGPSAVLHTSSKVIAVEPEKGTIWLANGTEVAADVVIGADGIYSMTRRYIKDTKLFSSGKAAFRFLISRQVAESDPITAPLVQKKGTLMMWCGDDRRIVMYPCNDNQLLNVVCIHPDTESHATKSDEWNKQGYIEQVLKVYREFDPAIKTLLGKVDPSTVKVWQLLDMEKLPAWTTAKLVLLGDAAHPFTPHQGQGASQAIEDAAALATVLPRGTASEEIPERLKLYQKIRYERAHAIQEYSRLAGVDWVDGKPTIDMMAFRDYNFGHDEIDHASNIFKRWKWAKKPDMYWRMPIAFGPFPGPLQDADGRRRVADSPSGRFTTMTVKFKTSRTFLETLFPTDEFRFKSPDTVTTATFSATNLDNLAWIGGKGYTHFGLYVHGVQYVKKDGTVIDGTYLPVLFESLADSVVSGREELGISKLFCDIDFHHDSKQNTGCMTASWRGAVFANICLSGLEQDDNLTAEDGTICGEPDEEGILVYQYIPAVGAPGKADAKYACEAKVRSARVEKVSRASPRASSGSGVAPQVKIDARDWKALPTLHHVMSVLAEVPIYEIVGAKVVEGSGAPDFSSSRRIE